VQVDVYCDCFVLFVPNFLKLGSVLLAAFYDLYRLLTVFFKNYDVNNIDELWLVSTDDVSMGAPQKVFQISSPSTELFAMREFCTPSPGGVNIPNFRLFWW